jgi:NADPH:quinone reductase-like Zn-dependent oxidoreductase
MIEKFYARTSQGQVHGRRVDGSGEPVVPLHRTPVSSAGFVRVLRFLAARGQAAIALDTPGFGASFVPEGAPSAADYGRWLLEAIDALGLDRFHLAAHHTGTHFAAERRQDRAGSRDEHRALAEFMVAHGLKPVIDRAFACDDAEAAYAHSAGGAFGKVVISLGDPGKTR